MTKATMKAMKDGIKATVGSLQSHSRLLPEMFIET